MQPLIKTLTVGPLATNCYIVADADTGDACVIDPGSDLSRVKKALAAAGLTARFIINTHGHGDHIGANSGLGVPVYIHERDAGLLTDPDKNLFEDVHVRHYLPGGFAASG